MLNLNFGGKRPFVLMQGDLINSHEDGGPSALSDDQRDLLIAERVARLSKGQLDCLLLVDQHWSSKEIAVELGISSHTVDQRIRGALQVLGVERRSQAARMVAQVHGPRSD